MTVKTSISLNDAQAEFARDLVEQGAFPSISAVAQHGIDLIRQRQDAEQTDMQALKALMQARVEGPFIGADAFGKRVDALLAKKRRANGLDG